MSWKNAATQIGSAVALPLVQWVNDGGMVIPRQPKGGFALPQSEAGVAKDVLKGAIPVTVRFRGGDETAYFSQQIRVAVLATRFVWMKDGVPIPAYAEGARGKVRVLALIEGEHGPFMGVLTFSGLASKDFWAAWRSHRERVRKQTRAAGQEAPASIFFMTLRAGTQEKMSQGSVRTTVVLSEEFSPDQDYIGDQAFALIRWDEVKTWAGAPSNGDEPEHDELQLETNKEEPEPQSHDLEWALRFPSPVGGKSFPKGTPLGELPGQAVQYIADNLADKYPDAARAARVILEHWAPEGDLPF